MSRSQKMSFRTLPCQRCGASRVLGDVCNECGKSGPAGEVNSVVVDRRTAVARINAALTPQVSPAKPTVDTTNLPTKEELREFVEGFVEALRAILKRPKSSAAVLGMVERLESFEALRLRCQSFPKLRPRVALHRSVSVTFDTLSGLWPTYAQVLSAPTIHEAIILGQRGQELLDSASETLTTHEELVNSALAYEDLSIQDLSERILTALSISHPDFSVLEMGQYGKRLAEEKTGVPTDEAHGIQYLTLHTVASVHMDPNRFNDVMAETARFCFASHRLQEIAIEDGALESLARSQRLLYESLTSFEAVVSRENDEKALLRRIIKFYGEVYEDVVSPLLAWYSLMAGIKQQPYPKLLKDDATNLAKGLLKHPATTTFLEDSGANLRNAAQHGNSYSVDGHLVRFNLRSYEETLSISSVIDQVFSLFESISAMSWSLSNALSNAGHAIPLREEDAAYMKLSAFYMAKFYLKHKGTPVLSSEESGSTWTFLLSPGQDRVFEIALAVSLGSPAQIRKVVLHTNAGETPLIIPQSAYNRVALLSETDSQPLDHVMAVLELRNDSTIGGRSLLRTSDLKFAAASLGILLTTKKDPTLIPHLRRVKTLAEAHGNQRIADRITEALRLNRIPNYLASARLSAKFKNWVEDNDAPSMPASYAVTVTK